MSRKDDLYSKHQDVVKDFVFNQDVVDVFDDMIHRSVPGYRSIMAMMGVLARQYIMPGTCYYDLGCSLGNAILAVDSAVEHHDFSVIAVDNSTEMLKECKTRLSGKSILKKTTFICEDLLQTHIDNASMVGINFTLQFIDLDQREGLIKKLYEGLNPGGMVVLSEKICFEDLDKQAFEERLHYLFKKHNGYSDLEISQKRTALDQVLIPETLDTIQNRFKKAGFSQTHVWFQCFNFMSMVAIK